MTTRVGTLLLFVVGGPVACANLPEVPASVCGNAVLEEGEECDTYAPEGQSCRGPEFTLGACRFDCTETPIKTPACPVVVGSVVMGSVCSSGACTLASGVLTWTGAIAPGSP